MKNYQRNLFLLILFVSVSTSARQQIPFGFFRTSGVSIVDGFENWSGSPSLPSGWSDTGSYTMPPSRLAAFFSEGVYSMTMTQDNAGTGDASNISKTFDLTGVTNMILDINSKTGNCTLRITIDGILVLSQMAAQSNITVDVSAHAGTGKVVNIYVQGVSTGSMAIDNLRFN
jgi:hypothetical protein